MACLLSVGENDSKDVSALSFEDQIRFGKVEILLRTLGNVASHELPVKVEQSITAGFEGQFPRSEPA